MEVVAEERVVAWPQHHGDLVVLWGQFLLAMEVLCLKPEIQCVVSGDSQFLAGLCLDCKKKGAGRSRLYQSYQEPGVELGEEVGLPFLSSVSQGLPGSNFLSSVSKPGQPWLFRTGVSLF